jgi:hypothetical protein
MKNLLLFTTFVVFNISFSQDWTWMKGSNTIGSAGSYGTIGVFASTNTPGAREGALMLVDSSGCLWLFGGKSSISTYDYYADLWKYNPKTNQWAWIKGPNSLNFGGQYGTQGVSNSTNNPGARNCSVGWSDNLGNIWIFGGKGFAGTNIGVLSDLWKYNISTNQWTWMKGINTLSYTGNYGTLGVSSSTNAPGARSIAHGFYNNGFLYLFGGNGNTPTSSGSLNDIWKYNISNNQWTWIKGSNVATNTNNYGTIGVETSTNVPCGRENAQFTSDGKGNFYLMGGENYPNVYYSDLWRYNVNSNNWTWIKAPNTTNISSVYGTQGVYASGNYPGSRCAGVLAYNNNDLYFFGGYGVNNSSGTSGYDANDLWQFDLTTNNWRYLKGTKLQYQLGVYGSLGVSSPSNYPGSREYTSMCVDKNLNLWLFGGQGRATTSTGGTLNDLWKYKSPCNNNLTISPQNNTLTVNSKAIFNAVTSDANPTFIWQSDFGQGYTTLINYGNYSGTTTSTLNIDKVQLSEHKQPFRAISTSGNCIDTSNVANITILDTCITSVIDTVKISVKDTLYIKVNTSSVNNPVYNTIKVYPNPSSTHIVIDNGNYSSMGSYTAKIVNSAGQQVFQSAINQQQFVIDARTIGGSGIYTLYITDANNNVVGVKKIVLQ